MSDYIYTNNELDNIYDFIIEYDIATEDEISLVTSINGYNESALNDIIFVRTGYRDMEQYKEYESEV